MVLTVEEDLSLEGAGNTFLAQYGFNSQIAPDWFDLQRMEEKSNETFREYCQRWREKAARARPPLDEREMIKIFVDTLKNPYFDRMIGLQLQFFVDLIPVGERIEDAVKIKAPAISIRRCCCDRWPTGCAVPMALVHSPVTR